MTVKKMVKKKKAGMAVGRRERYRQLDEPQIARVLMTVEQAATALSMCRYTVNKLIASGELQSIKIGRMRRVPTAALDEFVQRCVQPTHRGSSVA